MIHGTPLASVLAVVLAVVLVPALEFGGNDIHADELLPSFVSVFPKVLIVCHSAVEGTCEDLHDDMNHCPIRYFGVGVPSINFGKVILDWASLPEFVNLQVCPIWAVIGYII